MVNREERNPSAAFLSAAVVPSLVVVLLATFALAPQAAPPTGAEPPRERLPCGIAGLPEPPPHLVVEAGPSEALSAQAPASMASAGKLVFQSLRNGNWEIYRADGDGSNQTRLTHNSGSDIQPRVNRGCSRVAFAAYRGSNYDIYAVNADGTGEALLTWAADHDVNPAWSRDGTRIVFESYRTGQGDVYVMNPDGSLQTRLTSDEAWDGEPAWSPDGSAIAFTSYRNSVYRIWRMNADGSGQVQLSNQPYSGHAAWSPDSSLIAYNADGDGDGWYELWLMNADGTNHRQVYDPPEGDTDTWAGAWSPDGQYLAFTRISWIYYQGHWYWTTAYLDAWEMSTGLTYRLSGNGEDWYPDWQTADLWPPSSSVTPLPARSPGPVPVSWSGTDDGPAGVARYDVQVREEPGGAWCNWLTGTVQTSASCPGVGGHTYAFRSRAQDYGGNVEAWPADADASTTVEDVPPQTAVSPLEPYVREEVTVAWGGGDPGGSGIATYDVQLRDGLDGTWIDWQTGITQTGAILWGQAGHTYFFRSRGVDEAQNAEAWPPGDGDASTTVYLWAMTGTLRDNRETPVMGGSVDLIPEALAVMPSDVDGNFAAYEATASSVYSATWSKLGYGGLPATAFSEDTDAQAHMVLPPADNAVLNWGFESGGLGPGWLAGGEIPPAVTSEPSHTGRFAAALIPGGVLFDPWVNVSNTPGSSTEASVEVDGQGVVHVLWKDSGQELYARREPGASWSVPISVCGDYCTGWPETPQLAVQSDGTVHVAFVGEVPGPYRKIFYNRRSPDGTWSGAVNVSDYWGDSWAPDMALGVDGAVHLVWQDRSGPYGVVYARRSPDGTWSEVVNLADKIPDSGLPQVAAGREGLVHVAWVQDWPREVVYSWRGTDGTWSTPVNLPRMLELGGPVYPILAAGADGSVHVAWRESSYSLPDAIVYAHRSAEGIWSGPVQVSNPALAGLDPQLAPGPDGSVHLAWTTGGRVAYARRRADGVWSPLEVAGVGERPNLCVDSTGAAHLAWRRYGYPHWEVLYAMRTTGGVWSDPMNLSNTPAVLSEAPCLALDSHDRVHAVWLEVCDAGREIEAAQREIVYAGPANAPVTGDSILSLELTVPPEEAAPTLSFWYRLQGMPVAGTSWLAAQVDDGLSTTGLFSAEELHSWTHHWVDLSAWAGQAVTLRFLVHQTEGEPVAWATLDEVSVGPAYPDLWVAMSGRAAALPGEPVSFLITYGNRGGAPAGGVMLTETLAAGLQFVSADPPPSTVSPYLTWQAGDLPAASGPFEITLITDVEPSLPIGTTLSNAVAIGSSSPELETLNNEASRGLWVGWRGFLPVVSSDWWW